MSRELDVNWPQALLGSQIFFLWLRLQTHQVQSTQGGGMTWEFRTGVRSYSLRAKSSPTPVPLCGVQAGSGFKPGWIFVTDVTIENTNFEIQLREMLTPQKKNSIPFLSRLRLFQKLYFIIIVVVVF